MLLKLRPTIPGGGSLFRVNSTTVPKQTPCRSCPIYRHSAGVRDARKLGWKRGIPLGDGCVRGGGSAGDGVMITLTEFGTLHRGGLLLVAVSPHEGYLSRCVSLGVRHVLALNHTERRSDSVILVGPPPSRPAAAFELSAPRRSSVSAGVKCAERSPSSFGSVRGLAKGSMYRRCTTF